MIRPLTTAAVLLISTLPTFPARADVTPITECGALILAPGKYKLTGDLMYCPGIAVTINSDDVSLDLEGNEITCQRENGRPDAGVLVTGVSGVHVHNGKISDCDFGVQFFGTRESKVSDMKLARNLADGNPGIGIVLLQANDNQIVENRATENEIGIGLFFGSKGNRITGNTTNYNARAANNPFSFGMGITLGGSSQENLVACNVSDGNTDTGIVISSGASNNTVRDNVARDNLFYGIGAFTRIDLPVPRTVGNGIRNNSAHGNGSADVLEVLFDPLADPRATVEETCRNAWKNNGYVSELIPASCMSVPTNTDEHDDCDVADDGL